MSSHAKLIMDLFKRFGNNQYMIGEPITQLDHAIQSYSQMKKFTSCKYLHVAALLHDIGHMVPNHTSEVMIDPDTGVNDYHEIYGANFLKRLNFPKRVTEPVRLHVFAKQYLVTTNPSYLNTLSDASRKTFILQGGCLQEYQIESFRKNPFKEDALLLRLCDDTGKEVDEHEQFLSDDIEKLIASVLHWK